MDEGSWLPVRERLFANAVWVAPRQKGTPTENLSSAILAW